jgi:hypothetical protein
VLHHHHGVARVGEPSQQPQQPIDVARVQPDGRLIEHVQGVGEARAERIGEGDALGLAPRQAAGEPVQREVAESHIHDKGHARRELRQQVLRDGLLKRGQGELSDPLLQLGRGQRGDLGNGLSGEPHHEGFRLEPRPAACRAGLGELVLPQEDADVLLVALGLEPLQEWKDAEIAAGGVV